MTQGMKEEQHSQQLCTITKFKSIMIKNVSGDILLSDAQLIAHSVAPMDHFDSGLALSLREMYPSMVRDFRHYCHTYHPKTGEIWAWGGVGGKRIINLMAQAPVESKHSSGHPGKASISDVDRCLKNLAIYIQKEGIRSVALPRVATGVGGLDWEDVEAAIIKRLSDIPVDVFVYAQYKKDVKAEEFVGG